MDAKVAMVEQHPTMKVLGSHRDNNEDLFPEDILNVLEKIE